MAISLCEVSITDTPLVYAAAVANREAGAVVEFFGVVRATEGEKQIEGIDYQTHRTMAEHQLREIASAAATNFALLHTSICHRIGLVPVGEPSLHVRVASRHRAEAFAASEWIVDQLKQRVPIWKHLAGGETDGSGPGTNPDQAQRSLAGV